MNIRFEDSKLERLAKDLSFTNGFDRALVKSYRRLIQQIIAAADERIFYSVKSLHFEKLKGDRQGQYSMRLNKQWRLLLRFEQSQDGKQVAVIEIADYH